MRWDELPLRIEVIPKGDRATGPTSSACHTITAEVIRSLIVAFSSSAREPRN